jgi:putative restriction endonuclease
VVHIATGLLEDEDGPMLDVLKQAAGRTIELPTKESWYPDRERLAARFERFSAAA